MPDKTHYWGKPAINEEPYAVANDPTKDAEPPIKGMDLQQDKNEISKDKASKNPENCLLAPPSESHLLFAFAHSSFSVNFKACSNLPYVPVAVKS